MADASVRTGHPHRYIRVVSPSCRAEGRFSVTVAGAKQRIHELISQGAFVPGVKPGARTAEYIDRVLTRVTLPGSVYLALIALVPFFIFDIFNIQTFFFGGTGLLIVVGVALDTLQQIESHLVMRHYDGFMKKGKIRGRSM